MTIAVLRLQAKQALTAKDNINLQHQHNIWLHLDIFLNPRQAVAAPSLLRLYIYWTRQAAAIVHRLHIALLTLPLSPPALGSNPPNRQPNSCLL